MRLENKVALITGSASGIGREMARTFGKAGMRVAMAEPAVWARWKPNFLRKRGPR